MDTSIGLNWHNLLDWSLVAVLLVLAWRLVRGSLVVYLLLGVLAFNLLFQLGVWLELPLFTALLEQFVGLGVLALLVVFQPEIRNFLLLIGRKAESARISQLRRWLDHENQDSGQDHGWVRSVAEACARLAESRTGALLLLSDWLIYNRLQPQVRPSMRYPTPNYCRRSLRRNPPCTMGPSCCPVAA